MRDGCIESSTQHMLQHTTNKADKGLAKNIRCTHQAKMKQIYVHHSEAKLHKMVAIIPNHSYLNNEQLHVILRHVSIGLPMHKKRPIDNMELLSFS